MEMQPKLLAAADMCEAGEEVNLDELAFLLRYSADELAQRPKAQDERDRLLEHLRARLLARCDLLERPEADRVTAARGELAELESLDQALDRELHQRYLTPGEVPPESSNRPSSTAPFPADRFRSGR